MDSCQSVLHGQHIMKNHRQFRPHPVQAILDRLQAYSSDICTWFCADISIAVGRMSGTHCYSTSRQPYTTLTQGSRSATNTVQAPTLSQQHTTLNNNLQYTSEAISVSSAVHPVNGWHPFGLPSTSLYCSHRYPVLLYCCTKLPSKLLRRRWYALPAASWCGPCVLL